jgi:BMFP domain-containing protein YqiC
MSDRKLLEQALEALDYISRRDYDDTPLHDYELAKMRPAMSTLRERLAQPDPLQRFTDVQQEIEAALAPEQEQIAQAVQTVIQAMQDDPEYAWGWHCNIAMAFVDAGGDRYTANQGAARFLEMFAKVQPAHELPAPEQDLVAYEIEAKLKEKNT